MGDNNKKRDIRLILVMCLTIVVGAVNIILNGNFILLIPYFILILPPIPFLYFNYSLCKWHNTWHSMWHERNACDGEPSDFSLAMGKIGGWALFILAFIISLLSSI